MTNISDHLSGQRVLEAAGFDIGGRVVVPEMPPRAGSGLALVAPAVSAGTIVLLPHREEHLRDRAHDSAPDVPDPVLHDPEPAPSDRSSVVARFRQRISELESLRLRQRISELERKFEVGVSISVPDNSSSYATVSSASPL